MLKWITPTDTLNSNFIVMTTLHVSGSLSAHHQEFWAVHRLWYIICSYGNRMLPQVGWHWVPSHKVRIIIWIPFLHDTDKTSSEYVLYDFNMYCMTSICTVWLQYVLYDFNMYCMTSVCTVWLQYVLYGFSMYCMASQCTVWLQYVLYYFNIYCMTSIFTIWPQYVLYDFNMYCMTSVCTVWLQYVLYGFSMYCMTSLLWLLYFRYREFSFLAYSRHPRDWLLERDHGSRCHICRYSSLHDGRPDGV
jgi:hypothetical protein